MKLELATYTISSVHFGKATGYRDGSLTINKEELVNLILEDGKIVTADLDIALPGDKTRVVRVRDVVEPSVKVSGPGCVFPGILGPVQTVGEGRTHRLSGVTVVASAEYKPTILSGTAAQHSGIIDMWGPGAGVTPFGATINVVPSFMLADGVTELEAHSIIQMAMFKVARRLAETTRDQPPVNMETFDLTQTKNSLPKVIYIMTCLTEWHHPHSGVAYYGLPIRESLPTFMHPNELIDGAVTVDARRGGGTYQSTWAFQTHPIVMELLRKHGKDLNFIGVILQRTRFETEFGKKVTAAGTSQMARLLGADGAVLTRIIPSGNNFIDVMLTVQACEQKGIKTVYLTPEWGGKDGKEMPLAFYVPEATAMIATGSIERDIRLPAPEKIIGAGDFESVQLYAGDKPFSAVGEVTFPSWYFFTGGADWFGHLNLTCVQH